MKISKIKQLKEDKLRLEKEVKNYQERFDNIRLSKGHPQLMGFELNGMNNLIIEKTFELNEVNEELSCIYFTYWIIAVVIIATLISIVMHMEL